ncbi:MAG: hypothetical protein AAF934_07325, partial [Bacteroidota bacterium]
YVRSQNNLDNTTATKIANIITFIQHHTRWKDWTIPSKTTANNDVEILKVNANGDITGNAISDTNDSYTLQGSDGYWFTNTNYVNALTPDARNRIIRFLNVLYMASKRREISSNESTLKVFMAPEFYFRPEAAINNDSYQYYRGYTAPVYKAIKEVLRQTIKSMGLHHWLIIPGTIMWYMEKDTSKAGKTLAADTFFNSCIYIHNYPEIDTGWSGFSNNVVTAQTSHKLEKSRVSEIDGVPCNYWDIGNNASSVIPKYRDNKHLKKHIFPIDNVRTGIEICLEHAIGANNATTSRKVPLLAYINNGKPPLHLQLLTSGGMDILPDNTFNIRNLMTLRKGGVFFRNDGRNTEANTYINTNSYGYVYSGTWNVYFSDLHHSTITATVSINNDEYYELKAPTPPANHTFYERLPFNQQAVVIYDKEQIQKS